MRVYNCFVPHFINFYLLIYMKYLNISPKYVNGYLESFFFTFQSVGTKYGKY